MKSFNIILFSILILSSSFSQTDEYIFKQLTDADGLSQSTIFAMIQDREGYLWLGTIDGLNRYDGYEFRVYANDASIPSSISDNFISALCEDSDGFIWVGTVNGYLNRFDKKTEVFKRYFVNDFFETIKNPSTDFYDYPLAFSRNQANTITAITEDKDGYLWLGTWGKGLIKFDRKKGRASHFHNDPNDPLSLSSDLVIDIITDRDGNIWIATFGGGLNKLALDDSNNNDQFKARSAKFLHYRSIENNNSSLSDDKTISLFEDTNGNIWIGTFYGGLNRLDANNKTLTPDKAKFKSYQENNKLSNSISDNTVMAITQDFEGYLWIGTFGGGIDRFDIRTQTFTNFSELSNHQNSFTDVEILSLFSDRSGILWAGSHLGEGVTKIQKYYSKFESINSRSAGRLKLNDDVVWSLFRDSKDNLWVGTYRGGINVLNLDANQTKVYRRAPGQSNGISDNHIRSITEDKLENIWIGTYSGGLNRIDRTGQKVETFKNEPGNSNSLSANQVLDIYVESEKTIWVATFGGGLNKLTFAENTSGVPEFKSYKNNPSDRHSLSDDRVYCILKDNKENFWIGTYGGGLNKFNSEKGIFEVVSLDIQSSQSAFNDKILSLHESSNGMLWIGTSGNGLNQFDPKSNTVMNFSLAQGLTSSVVYGILEDSKSNLWLSTDDGIFLFNSSTEKFAQFGIEDGVQSLEFSGGAYFKDSGGMMYFGGINGFNYFNPDSITINQYVPPVVISNIKVMDVRVNGEPDELILSYDQNFISVEFSALDFSMPKRNKYSYILEGFQKSWISTGGSNRTATYTNLPSGEFTFMVKGSNSDGIWSDNAATIRIIINPPFYQTWWFVTLIVIIIVFFIYYLGTIRVKSQLEIEKLKLKIASDLHDNIGAGLTEISILSEVAERTEGHSSSIVKKDLQKISETARHLVDSMSDIVWVVNPQRDSLHDLIVKLKDSYNEFFSSIGISFQVNNVEKSDDIKLPMDYKQNLLLMFKEAINNAIKYSGCKKLKLEAFFRNDVIEIILKDDGAGFNLNEVKFGNGIRNMENRAKKIKGKLSWKSEIGVGTTVVFSGKLGKINRIKSLFK
ncbi:MAG: histidine kinase [Ignavibacteriaceae bacterium]|nr:histidine kinase [Ignavibacteriaceae bacterium]